MPEKVDLGTVHSIEVRPDPSDHEIMAMQIWQHNGEKIILAVQREALRALWSNLMQILYPRAVDLTQRMETVVRRKDNVPEDVTYMITAYGDSADPSLVAIGGFTPRVYWFLKLSVDGCENLWTSLEDNLNQV